MKISASTFTSVTTATLAMINYTKSDQSLTKQRKTSRDCTTLTVKLLLTRPWPSSRDNVDSYNMYQPNPTYGESKHGHCATQHHTTWVPLTFTQAKIWFMMLKRHHLAHVWRRNFWLIWMCYRNITTCILTTISLVSISSSSSWPTDHVHVELCVQTQRACLLNWKMPNWRKAGSMWIAGRGMTAMAWCEEKRNICVLTSAKKVDNIEINRAGNADNQPISITNHVPFKNRLNISMLWTRMIKWAHTTDQQRRHSSGGSISTGFWLLCLSGSAIVTVLPCDVIFCHHVWTMSHGGIVTSQCHIGRMSVLFFISVSFSFVDCLFCRGWQLSHRFFLAVADSSDIFSARWGYVFYL